MKKITQHIVLLIAAIAVFFTGTGVTIINYCCSHCEAEQTLIMASVPDCCSQKKVVIEQTCCSDHNSSNNHKSDSDGCNVSNKEHCKATRLSSDIDIATARQHLQIPYVWISDLYSSLPTSIVLSKIEVADKLAELESPPDIPPREYLSLIRVLII